MPHLPSSPALKVTPPLPLCAQAASAGLCFEGGGQTTAQTCWNTCCWRSRSFLLLHWLSSLCLLLLSATPLLNFHEPPPLLLAVFVECRNTTLPHSDQHCCRCCDWLGWLQGSAENSPPPSTVNSFHSALFLPPPPSSVLPCPPPLQLLLLVDCTDSASAGERWELGQGSGPHWPPWERIRLTPKNIWLHAHTGTLHGHTMSHCTSVDYLTALSKRQINTRTLKPPFSQTNVLHEVRVEITVSFLSFGAAFESQDTLTCTCKESFWLSWGGNRTTFSGAPSSGCNGGMKEFKNTAPTHWNRSIQPLQVEQKWQCSASSFQWDPVCMCSEPIAHEKNLYFNPIRLILNSSAEVAQSHVESTGLGQLSLTCTRT